MPNTLTEVEVKKATATNNSATTNIVPDYEEQPRRGRLFWILAPLTLLTTACAAFLVVRRWLNNHDDERLM